MSGISTSIAKQIVKETLSTYSENQLNLASESAREVLATMIVGALEKRLRLSIQVSSPAFVDKTLTLDMEDNINA